MTFEVGGVLINAQPETHRSRSCSDFSNGDRRPDGGDDDGPDDGDGEPVPAPRSRVRQLFPITPAPIAA
ncbi:hypothetical protein L286_11825 [Sphingobium sp. HDIP04]|nr:hypothetical protein L286_11825 [Sphingobium sp. HDIP04]